MITNSVDRQIVYDEYTQLISGVFHYQDQQSEMKIICLKIILGTFAIIGLLAFSNIDLSNFWFSLLCAVLPLFALFAVIVSFFNGLVYKERLKLGFFSEAVKLEKENKWIPGFHKSLNGETNMVSTPILKQILRQKQFMMIKGMNFYPFYILKEKSLSNISVK